MGHFPRPPTRFTAELYPAPAALGFRWATRRYGLLLDHVEWAFVEGWGYLCPRPVSPLREWPERTRAGWDALVASSEQLRRRLSTSATVFERRPWRAELAGWDGRVKPALARGNRRLSAVEPTELDDEGLVAYLDRCRANLRLAIYVHHRYNVTTAVPVGDLLVWAGGWTGRPASELLRLLEGAGPAATEAALELGRLARATSAHPRASEALQRDGDPSRVLADLRVALADGPAAGDLAEYLDVVGSWSAGAGTDPAEPSLGETPGLLVAILRAAGDRSAPGDHDEAVADVRSAVPPGERARFDELVAEARAVHRLRDERALACDVWACGIMRRAALAAGERLVTRGALAAPDQFLEAAPGEMRALLRRRHGPSAGELAERAAGRAAARPDDAPPVLGGPSPPPVPVAWLPPAADRTERAFRAYMAAMSGDEDRRGGDVVRGMAASPGAYEGRTRVVAGAADVAAFRPGEVLVSASTSPAFNPVMHLAGAVVTDHGGLLSHAAIVAREYGIPAVVATGDATRRLPEGALVRVDGDAGEVTVVR